MKRHRHTPEQVVRKLREGERLLSEGKDLAEVLRTGCRMRRCHMSRVPPLPVNALEREELERLVRAHTTPQRLVRRARAILLAADGVPNRRIAKEVGMSQDYV